MSDKPFTWRRNGRFSPDTVYLNGVELTADDICDLLSHLPVTADGVPLCLCGTTYCPHCGGATFGCVDSISPTDEACWDCHQVVGPTDRLSKPREGNASA